MPKTIKQYIQEAIGNKNVNHQLLTKKGYELMGMDQYHKKGQAGVKLKKGAEWVSLKNPHLKGKSSTDLARYLRLTGNFQFNEDTVNSEAQAKKLYKKYKNELKRYDNMEKRNIRMLPGEQSRSRELRYKMNKLKKMVGSDYQMEETENVNEKCHKPVKESSHQNLKRKPVDLAKEWEKELAYRRAIHPSKKRETPENPIRVPEKKNPEVKEGMSWKPYAFRQKREKEMNINREKEKTQGMKKIPTDMKFKQKNS